jgi:hypothetical protein
MKCFSFKLGCIGRVAGPDQKVLSPESWVLGTGYFKHLRSTLREGSLFERLGWL